MYLLLYAEIVKIMILTYKLTVTKTNENEIIIHITPPKSL